MKRKTHILKPSKLESRTYCGKSGVGFTAGGSLVIVPPTEATCFTCRKLCEETVAHLEAKP